MLKIVFSSKFLKDLKKAKQRHLDINKLNGVITRLANELPLEAKFNNHKLLGDFKDCFECRIEPNWLLIYKIRKKEVELLLIRTGTHSDLF